jgi:hypothetical protein
MALDDRLTSGVDITGNFHPGVDGQALTFKPLRSSRSRPLMADLLALLPALFLNR